MSETFLPLQCGLYSLSSIGRVKKARVKKSSELVENGDAQSPNQVHPKSYLLLLNTRT